MGITYSQMFGEEQSDAEVQENSAAGERRVFLVREEDLYLYGDRLNVGHSKNAAELCLLHGSHWKWLISATGAFQQRISYHFISYISSAFHVSTSAWFPPQEPWVP